MTQSYAALTTFWPWICSTFPRSPSKRAIVIAFVNTCNAMGNIAGSYIWPKAWGESYRYSYAICIAANGLAIIMIIAFRAHLKALNEKTVRGERRGDPLSGYLYQL